MEWQARLLRESLCLSGPACDHLYHVGLRPPIPPEYEVAGLVAVTFRLRARANGGHVYATCLDVGAALQLGARMGLDEAESLAFVDSHERMHIELQLAGVESEIEEDCSRLVDAVWLSFRHPRAAERLTAGAFGLVTRVGEDFWEEVLDSA